MIKITSITGIIWIPRQSIDLISNTNRCDTMASYKRVHSDTATEPMAVVQRTTSRTTTTTVATTTTTVVTTTTNGQGTTKETAIRIEDDETPAPKTKKKRVSKRKVYPCGDYAWVPLDDAELEAYDAAVCKKCMRHPELKYDVHTKPFFVHDEMGDYECPHGDCAGTLRYVCFECRRL